MAAITSSSKSSFAAGIRPPRAMWAMVVVLLVATSGVECSQRRKPCKKGYGYFKVGKKYICLKCPVGTIPKGYICVACPPGKSTLFKGSTKCLKKCPPGYGSTGGSCSPCSKGYYREGLKLAPCNKCKTGYTTKYSKSTSSSKCSVCKAGFGTLSSTAPCTTCAKGSFATGGSLKACTACPNNGTTRNPGATTSKSCF